MADLTLLSASIGLTICISRQVDVTSKHPSLKLALGLSLALFSLTILEATPSSLFVLLGHDDDDSRGYLTMTNAYRMLLWVMSLLVVVVLPFAAGSRLVSGLERRRLDDPDEQKYHDRWHHQLNRHWAFRYLGYVLRILLAIPLVLLRILVKYCAKKLLRRRKAEPVLVLSNGAERGSRHGPSSPSVNSTKRGDQWRSYAIGGLSGVTIVGIMLWSMGSLLIQSPSNNLLAIMVSWLCAIGLLLSSILNGFGSVSLPHSCLIGLYLEPIGPEVIAKAEVELQKAANALAEKRNELTLTLPSASSSNDLASMKRTWTGSTGAKVFGDYGDEDTQRRQQAQREVDFLENLVDELTNDIEDMKFAKLIGEQARTPMGKIRFYLGFVFSLILLIRLGTSFASIWHPSDTTATRRADPITTALLWLTGHDLVSVDYNALSQFVSLLLTAFLSMSQVRVFLRTVSALNRRLRSFYRKCHCKSRKASTSRMTSSLESMQQSYADLLAALMGCYFLSSIVMTKRILPLMYRTSFSRAIGAEFVVQMSVANSVFCASAVVSTMVLGMLFGIQRQNTKRHITDDTIGSLGAC